MVVDQELCIGCGRCVPYCPVRAISIVEYSARDCAPQPLKLSIHSGGIEHPCRCR